MILTLAINAVLLGLAIIYTGGFAPQTKASPLMRELGRESTVLAIPNLLLGLARFVGRPGAAAAPNGARPEIYATGNRERASYLSGIRTAASSLPAS